MAQPDNASTFRSLPQLIITSFHDRMRGDANVPGSIATALQDCARADGLPDRTILLNAVTSAVEREERK